MYVRSNNLYLEETSLSPEDEEKRIGVLYDIFSLTSNRNLL